MYIKGNTDCIFLTIFFVTVCQEGNFEQLHLTQLVCAHAVNLFIGKYEEAILIINKVTRLALQVCYIARLEWVI